MEQPPTRRAQLQRPRCRRNSVPLLAAFAVMVACAACTVEARHSVLSFLFDGVPDPNAPAAPQAAPPSASLHPLTLEERAALQQERLPASTFSFHPPYQRRECTNCHAVRRTGGFVQGVPELVAPIEKLCSRCHQVPKAAYVHGPVATTSCYLCHEHHASPNPHLLKAATPSELCARCHHGQTFVTEQKHAVYGDKKCTECHDPHSSERQFLLRPTAPAPQPDAPRPVRDEER